MIVYPLGKVLIWRRKQLRLNLAYDNVLKASCLQKETILSERERLECMLEMLVIDYKKVRRLPAKEKAEILQMIISDYISVKTKSTGDNTKLFDFEQDAAYIYASFYQAYSMDLQHEIGRLDWREFIALFQGLPDDTKLKQVMSIRGRKMPEPTKYNGEEIRALREAKAYYALEVSAEEAEANFQKGLDKLADKLMQGVEKGG